MYRQLIGVALMLMPLAAYAGRLRTLEVNIGGESLRMLLDTGGGQTLVVPSVAKQLGCASNGLSTGFRMSGERVQFERCGPRTMLVGGYVLAIPELAVFDVNALLPAGLPKLDGVLALDVFAQTPITLELKANRLVVETVRSLRSRAAHGENVPMRIATGVDGASAVVFVAATTPTAQQVWLELDSGNLDAVLLGRHVGTGDAGSPASTITLKLGAFETPPIRYSVRDLIWDGALNAQFMEAHAITIDMSREKLWLSR
jgi:hypothetical protein